MTRSIPVRTSCCVLAALCFAALTGCGSGSALGSGGSVSSGGIAGGGTGGTKSTGGTTATGGVTKSGGVAPNGGTVGAGGIGPSGGTIGAGGTTGAGGGTETGGTTTPTGGVTGTGGTAGTGGAGGAGKTCGGIAGVTCATNEFCDLQAGSCNVSDATGTCVANVGVACPTSVQYVCGCNGKTYKNDCERQVAGVSKKSDGLCPLMKPTLPAACQVDGDCCVAIEDCLCMEYLVGKSEFYAMGASMEDYDSYQTTCWSCIPPSVQVQCQDGVCVGQKLSDDDPSSALSGSHCGYLSLSDAGVTSAP